MPQEWLLNQQMAQWRAQAQPPEEMQAGQERRIEYPERQLPFAPVRIGQAEKEMEEEVSARTAKSTG